MRGNGIRIARRWALAAGVTLVILNATASDDATAWEGAERSAEIAGHSLNKIHRWLHEVALKKIDPKTGLYVADGKWNYRDTAADCMPFLTWAAWAVDLDAFNGPVRSALHAERALCNRLDRIPASYDLTKGELTNPNKADLVFEASEYVKDGLIAMVEITGRDEWFDRMRAIEDDLWKHADIDTPFGKIVSTNVEVNGEQIQALARLHTMTGDPKYLDWAERLADYYLSNENYTPERLRDHGCEIIGGLGLLLGVESEVNPAKAKQYAPRLRKMFDDVLKRGQIEDGMMYNVIRPADNPSAKLGGWQDGMSDGWGYNYVSYICYDMVMDQPVYRAHIVATLDSLMKPKYQNYPWEGESIDGYADSIEGALYLLNRYPSEKGLAWVDRETRVNLVDHPKRKEHGELWGTMKLQANGVRTTLIHALMHTQGVVARPWLQGMELGAAPVNDGLAIVVRSTEAYEGLLEFDIPRHRLYMGFKRDWPRMNTIPEWFVVEPEASYTVTIDSGEARIFTGQQLHTGLAVTVPAKGETRVLIQPNDSEGK